MNTPGRMALLALTQRITATEVALRVHVSQKAVCKWRSGLCTPAPVHRALLQREFGIAQSAWTVQQPES